MGRALVRRPQAFLLDEPLSNLDAKLRTQVRGDLKRLHRELPVTSIYVTHDQVEAMTLGDRICVMSNGEVQQIGTTDDIYNRPANTFVAGFMGSPPMNLLPGGRAEGIVRVAGVEVARVSVSRPARDPRRTTGGPAHRGSGCRRRRSGPESTSASRWAATCSSTRWWTPHGGSSGGDPTTVIVQAPPGTFFDAGARVGLTVPPAKTYLFDAETGAADLTPERIALS